ncbi:hypothetical protein FP803_03930 [Candidatus Woesearchaeota archaeon]|nr:hypothetical protein [Candidatus Woesearchaeota archaeon]MBU3912857.1 hypothetical protein [Nanoarchaeota archaeon]
MGKNSMAKFISFLMWLTGVIVALTIGFAMIGGSLSLPAWLGGAALAMIAGWVVVITTLLGVVLKIIELIK